MGNKFNIPISAKRHQNTMLAILIIGMFVPVALKNGLVLDIIIVQPLANNNTAAVAVML